MRVVLDTNVLLSGIFFGGVPGQILDAYAEGRLELVLSPEILAEYRRAGTELSVRYPSRRDALSPVLALLAMRATLVDVVPWPAPISADPEDDKFLAAALAGGAAIVISGDRHLRDVSGWRGIEVLTTRQFVDGHL